MIQFVAASQQALSDPKKVLVTGSDVKQVVLVDGYPATRDDLRRSLDAVLTDCFNVRGASKLRFIVE